MRIVSFIPFSSRGKKTHDLPRRKNADKGSKKSIFHFLGSNLITFSFLYFRPPHFSFLLGIFLIAVFCFDDTQMYSTKKEILGRNVPELPAGNVCSANPLLTVKGNENAL